MSSFREPRFTGSNFTMDGVKLTITVTDVVDDTAVPVDQMEHRKDGTVRWYRPEALTSKTSKHWRKTLANEICTKFLGFPLDRQYALTAFPSGYHLYTHMEGRNVSSSRSQDTVRTDAYLFGGGYKFRSPAEFLCHLAWIMRGCPMNRCRCIYDTSDKRLKKQGPLNKTMAKEWKIYLDERVKRNAAHTLAYRRHETDDPYPPTPVDEFNDDMFLLTIT